MADKTVRNIADIAKLAGVSKSTVSRALNDSSLISAKTKARIHAIAEASNFAVHQGARNLSLQRTKTLAVVIPINPQIGRFVTDPFNLELLGSIANETANYGYDLLVAQVRKGEPRSIDHPLASKRADGLILFACDLDPQEVASLAEKQAPFVLWGPPPPDKSYATVGSDDVDGGYQATRHLLELERQRVAFIGGLEDMPEVNQRFQGHHQALAEAGQTVEESLIVYGDYTSQSGYEAMQTLLARRPDLDAVFVNSDVMAIGALEALREEQRQVPHQVAVVGYDGVPLAAHCSPPLTTIRQDITLAGQLLVQKLRQYLEDGRITNTVIPVELVARESTIG